jgi:hypothetical protein
MRVFIAAVVLASFVFGIMVFALVPPHAEAGRATVNASPCPASAAKWCQGFGGLAE